MGLAGCGKFVKFTMIASNILIFIGGISVLGVGIWTCVDKTSFADFVGNDLYLSAAYIMCGTGAVIAIISFLGCFGALVENKCLLVIYFIILLIIFVVLLVAGILGYVYKGEISQEVRVRMYNTIKNDYKKSNKIKDIYDTMQRELKCCGVSQPNDRKPAYEVWNGVVNTGKIPESCCDKSKKFNTADMCRGSPDLYAYKNDCYNATKNAATEHAAIVGGVGVGIACLLLLGMIFSFILCMTIQ